MNPRFRILLALLALFMGIFLIASQTLAAKPIAQISSSEGEVIIQSDTKIFRVTELGLTLKDGDRIQTKQGEAKIVFNDGAVMKIMPFTNTIIQEREEKSGFWIFKTKKMARRITCFVGKLWFKTGASKRKNYLQTPTAVCGIRGSEGNIGFDNINTYINMYTGEAKVMGKVMRGFFANPGIDAATKSRVYQSLARAYTIYRRAEATMRTLDLARARVEAIKVIKKAAIELQRNPDDTVRKEAQVASNVAAADIAVGEAKIAVEQLIEAEASDADIQIAMNALGHSQAQAAAASKAADSTYIDGILDPGRIDKAIADTAIAAEKAKVAAQWATSIRDQIVPPEEVAPEEIPPEDVPPEEMPPEEAPADEVPREEAVPEELLPEVALPDTEASEQEVYWEEASPSQ